MSAPAPAFFCVVCQEDKARHHMAKTPCVSLHGYVCCKLCLLKWFEQKLTCPLCSTPAPIKSCLRKSQWRARAELQLARKREQVRATVVAASADEDAARELARQDQADLLDMMEAYIVWL
jgi:hypothetical protein